VADDRCDLLCLDLPRAEEIRRELDVAAAGRAAVTAKALGDPTRLTIAMALRVGEELCVCDLGWITMKAENLVGHHLRALREAGLARSRRAGKIVFYSLTTLPVPVPGGPDSSERDRLIGCAKALSWLSLAWMTVEGAVAITAALIAGSVALLGFGIDSAIEALASVIVIWRFTGSRRLYEQAEQRAQKAVAISFFLLAPYVAQDAVRALIAAQHPSVTWVGIGLSVSSIVVMPLLGRAKHRIGERLGSGAIAGEGAQNVLCAYMAAGVVVGLGANAAFGWWSLDPMIALAIAAIAVREGREAWAGEGCACVAVPGLQANGCQDDCC
jgi:DNA-binding transcriptional ArsR family regulator